MTDWEIVLKEWPRLASGFGTTLLLFGISAVGAFRLGALMVGPLRSRSKIVRIALRSYVDGMRMLPFLIFGARRLRKKQRQDIALGAAVSDDSY